MTDALLQAYVAVRSRVLSVRHEIDERGEGVISAAIAVLVMAFLGVLMWLAYRGIFQDAANKTGDQVNQIGN